MVTALSWAGWEESGFQSTAWALALCLASGWGPFPFRSRWEDDENVRQTNHALNGISPCHKEVRAELARTRNLGSSQSWESSCLPQKMDT